MFIYACIYICVYIPLELSTCYRRFSTTLLLTNDFQTHRRPVEMSWTSPEGVQEEPNGLVMVDRC